MRSFFTVLGFVLACPMAFSAELQVGAQAPAFVLKNQAGKEFNLASRKGAWTVLYFYPKAETPGCTKQACAFRDSMSEIRKLGADVYGVSVDTVEDQAKFHSNHRLSFDLLADASGQVTALYGAKMPLVNMARRWTFIIGPDLRILAIDKNVDPVQDPHRVSETLRKLRHESTEPASKR